MSGKFSSNFFVVSGNLLSYTFSLSEKRFIFSFVVFSKSKDFCLSNYLILITLFSLLTDFDNFFV